MNKAGLASPALASENSSLTSTMIWCPVHLRDFLWVQRKGQDTIFHAGVQACYELVSCTSPSNQREFKCFLPADLNLILEMFKFSHTSRRSSGTSHVPP